MSQLHADDAAALLPRRGLRVEGLARLSRRSLVAGVTAALPVLAMARAAEVHFDRIDALLVTERGRFPLRLELARTPAQRTRGLMFRTELAADAGMLFDFGGTQPVAMWMKDTLLPLDMLFLDAQLRVVWIHAGAEPLSLAIIQAPMPVAYVLELLAGSVQRYGITPGSRLEIGAGG